MHGYSRLRRRCHLVVSSARGDRHFALVEEFDGVDVVHIPTCVHEYTHDCSSANKRSAYIPYLDKTHTTNISNILSR